MKLRHLLYILSRRIFWIIFIIFLLILLGVFEIGRWSVYQDHPELSQTEQAKVLLQKVGQLIQLPNETPNILTITDALSARKAQPFLVSALNGDVLIVYQQAGEAILYRPSTDKLIAVGPVDRSTPTQPSSTQTATSTIKAASSTNATTTKSKK